MVTIRLARGGSKKRPFYHIVAAEKRRAATGKFIERLGYFNPIAAGQETRLSIELDRLDHWLGTGAQLSDRVSKLVSDFRNQAKG